MRSQGIDDPAARLYYLRAAANFGWSRNVLLNQIKAKPMNAPSRRRRRTTLRSPCPRRLAEQADEMLKSRYNLEFLGIARPSRSASSRTG